MRRSVWFYTGLFLVAYALHTLAADWPVVIKPVMDTVARLEIENGENAGICSMALFNEAQGYGLTMAHCTGTDPKPLSLAVNGRHADLIRANTVIDLAVIKFDVKKEKQIALAKETPPAGSEIALLGFAFGSRHVHTQFGHVSLPLEDDGRLMLDVTVIHGDSGGMAINAQGELVGMTSALKRSGGYLTVMVPVETVRDFIKPWLPK